MPYSQQYELHILDGGIFCLHIIKTVCARLYPFLSVFLALQIFGNFVILTYVATTKGPKAKIADFVRLTRWSKLDKQICQIRVKCCVLHLLTLSTK